MAYFEIPIKINIPDEPEQYSLNVDPDTGEIIDESEGSDNA